MQLIIIPQAGYGPQHHMFPINQPEVMIGSAHTRFDQEGNLTDETTQEFIRQLLQNLVAWTQRLNQP